MNCFEGSEKKVEIMLRPDKPSLRTMHDSWHRVIAAANATVLSSIHSTACDAFLLSESSLFVRDLSATMITCGTTCLVSAVEEMCSFIDPDDVTLLIFERKNEYFPSKQPADFDADVLRLRKLFPGSQLTLGPNEGNHVHLFHYGRDFTPPAGDMTMELLMHGLSEQARTLFTSSGLTSFKLCDQTAIHKVIEGFVVDDHLFQPMGYSLNALKNTEYFTLHVTPEERFSYASFETNHHFDDAGTQIVKRVLDIFQPSSYSLLLFRQEPTEMPHSAGYEADEAVTIHDRGYEIAFRNYRRI